MSNLKVCNILSVVILITLLISLNSGKWKFNSFRSKLKPVGLQREEKQRKSKPKEIPIQEGEEQQSCEPKRNLVFVKTHKTGGTTISSILQRYVMYNKLQPFVKKGGTLGYRNQALNFNTVKDLIPPMGVKSGNYAKYKYNLFFAHARYNRTVFQSFMEANTTYITILRDPVTQFESIFDFFNVQGGSKDPVTKTNKLKMFMSNPSLHWNQLTSRDSRKFTHNNQLWDLGVNPELDVHDVLVEKEIQRLDNELDLVMITEMFDESLLILKQKMCWRFEDIVYLAHNQRSQRAQLTHDIRTNISRWNANDMKLYSYFKNRFEDHIKNYGPTFEKDLAVFRNMTSFLYRTCVAAKTVFKKNTVVFKYNKDSVLSNQGICKRVKSLDVCNFGGGYVLSLDLNRLCDISVLRERPMIGRIKKMMKQAD